MSVDTGDDRTKGLDPCADPIGMRLDAIREQLDVISEVPVWTLDDGTLQSRLWHVTQISSAVDELAARLTSTAVERDLAKSRGFSSSRAWLMAEGTMSAGSAGRLLARATAMFPLTEVTRQAWASGQVTSEQAIEIGTAIRALESESPSSLRAAQVDLIAQAKVLSFAEFRIVCRHLVEVVDPDGADELLAEQLRAEELHAMQHSEFRLRRVGDGTTRFSGRCPDLQAEMLRRALESVASPRRAASSRHNGGGGGRGESFFNVDGDHSDSEIGLLNPSQRMGRAFTELIEHLPTDELPQHGVANATVVVTVDQTQLASDLGEAILDSGTRISAGEARRLACNANLLPVVLDGPSRILDVGTAKRLYDRYQRVALAVRDGGCIWPGCARPPAWCEAHHITAWAAGGPTDLANGCLLCSWHHHLLHKGEWAVRMAAGGVPELVPPARIDPSRRPQRHPRLLARAGPTTRC